MSIVHSLASRRDQAYELSTLTGTQVLLLVVSETGLVYTFTTAKLQPLVTQPEGKNLIQACLNAPHGTLPSSMPVGAPLGRSNPMSMGAHHGPTPAAPNVPGGLSIAGGSAGKDEGEEVEPEDAVAPEGDRPRKRRRASSSAGAQSNQASGGNAPGQQRQNPSPGAVPASIPSTSPHARTQPMPAVPGAPPALSIPQPGQSMQPGLEQHSPRQGQPAPGVQPTSPNYSTGNAYGAPQGDPNMYGAPAPGGHAGYPGAPPYGYDASAPGGQGGAMPAAHGGGPWGAPPQVQQGNHYARR